MSDMEGRDESRAGPVADVDGTAEAMRVSIKVNGMTVEVAGSVMVREILTQARDAGAIEGSVDEYVIERVETEGEIGVDERIMVKEREEFFAVPTGRTPVAQMFETVRPEDSHER